MNPLQWLLVALIQAYRYLLSPLQRCLGPGVGCRFEPSCSVYALEAIVRRGAWVGLGLTVRRLCHCHPWGGSGYDPVPLASNRSTGGRASLSDF